MNVLRVSIRIRPEGRIKQELHADGDDNGRVLVLTGQPAAQVFVTRVGLDVAVMLDYRPIGDSAKKIDDWLDNATP
jgi:hypothetical protein